MPDRFRPFVVVAATALLLPAPLGYCRLEELRARPRIHGFNPHRLAAVGRRGLARPERRDHRGAEGLGAGLSLDRAYQDVAFSVSFRCAEGCSAGVLLRAEKTADGGLKGIYASLVADDLVLVSGHDRRAGKGNVSRAAASGGRRAGPSRTPTASRHRRPGPLLPARAAAPEAAAPEAAAVDLSRCRCRVASSRRLPGQSTGLPARPVEHRSSSSSMPTSSAPFLNDAGGVQRRRRRRRVRALRPDRALRRRHRRSAIQGRVLQGSPAQSRANRSRCSRRFRMQALNEFYYSWGPAVADINRDGMPDIVAGPYYYLGPDYNVAREIYMAKTIDAEHAVLQRRAVCLRLHRRRLAGRDQRRSSRSRRFFTSTPRRVTALGERSP